MLVPRFLFTDLDRILEDLVQIDRCEIFGTVPGLIQAREDQQVVDDRLKTV